MIRDLLFLVLFFLLAFLWLIGWTLFHLAGGLMHILLVLALVSLVVHLFRGNRAV